jgi:hypothetical protein
MEKFILTEAQVARQATSRVKSVFIIFHVKGNDQKEFVLAGQAGHYSQDSDITQRRQNVPVEFPRLKMQSC